MDRGWEFKLGLIKCVQGNHAFVEEFFTGKFITARGFATDLGSIGNIPIANFCMIVMHNMVKL